MANKETKRLGNKGFSLVELIVVIAIMAVLVGVLAPQFIKYVEKSRESTDITNLDSIKQVVESYYADKEGTDLPTKVVIKVGTATSGATNVYILDITGGTAHSDDILQQGGVKDTPVKGSGWTKTGCSYPEAEWDLSNNTWKYKAESDYYTTSNSQIKAK